MRAIQLLEVGRDPQLREVPSPLPGPGEVRVAVRACGICGSDVHVVSGEIAVPHLPLTLGHESAGVVDAVGEGAAVEVGTRVVVNPILACGSCRACRAGSTNLCPQHRVLGVNAPGAAADHVVVPAQNLHALPDALGFAQGAILADAVAGPFRAVVRSGLQAGDTAVVVGLGGLGLHAALVLRQVIGARVIGVDVRESALERAAALGIDHVVHAGDGRPSRAVHALTDGGADASFEFAGRLEAVEQALRSLRPGGTCTVMGVTPERLSLGIRIDALVSREWQLRGSYGYTGADLDAVLEAVSSGILDVDGTISGTLPLERYAEGLDALRSPEAGASRVVVEVGGAA